MKHALLALICLLLAGCHAHHQTTQDAHHQGKRTSSHPAAAATTKKSSAAQDRDGAPSGPIPNFFKRVFPKAEPISRYGNPGTYRVNGRTYEVLTNAHGYRERGLASWYGTKFHRKRTSSGEDYNLYELTAAHRTLPLPTYVRVKNLSNGRQIVVKVNDRGPFHEGRIIDLSYGAALKLGLLPKGTAPVEVEAISVKGAKHHAAQYYLQVGAYANPALAKTMSHQVTKWVHKPVRIEKYRQYHVVNLGPFADKRSCDQAKVVLARHGITGAFSLLK